MFKMSFFFFFFFFFRLFLFCFEKMILVDVHCDSVLVSILWLCFCCHLSLLSIGNLSVLTQIDTTDGDKGFVWKATSL